MITMDYMKNVKYPLMFCFFSFIILSCNEKNDLRKTDKKSILSDTGGNVVQSQKQEKKVAVMDGLKLAEFLPTSVPGCEKTPDKTGVIDENDMIITVASSEYLFPNNGFLKYSITDYGVYKNIPDYEIKLFSKPPVESGKETEEFIISNGKGYIIWDNSRKEGSLFALVADRFILRIEGIRLTQTQLKLQDYIKYFKLKELLKSLN